jgi:pentatricopeptide repeat protein
MTPISLWAEAFSACIPSEGAWRMLHKVLELMRQMQQQEGVEPDPVTFARVVIEYATVATLEDGKCIHESSHKVDWTLTSFCQHVVISLACMLNMGV